MKKLTIAVDGHSSSGKSSFARAIAAALGYTFIDTGAMYRAVTLWALEQGLAADGVLDVAGLVARLGEVDLERFSPNDPRLRSLEVSGLVSRVSSIPEVRKMLVFRQQQMGLGGGVVMDGRDIGTVVFPNADLKIFLTADPAVRARRRFEELGGTVPLAEIEENIRTRDHLDETREVSPLRRAADAVVLDNSFMTPDEQMEWVLERLRK